MQQQLHMYARTRADTHTDLLLHLEELHPPKEQWFVI